MTTYIGQLAERIRSHVPDDKVPDDSRDLFLTYAVLARAKGLDVTREDVHDAWVAWCDARGVTHESAVPFEQLDPATKSEDDPFVCAIRAAVRSF